MTNATKNAVVNTTTQNQQSLIKKSEQQTISDFINMRVSKIMSQNDKQRFLAGVISAITTNSALNNCDKGSIVNCALLGESLKLSPSPQLGQYYMVPFGNKATFILGYKGYIQLAIRSGYYKKINVISIKEGELVKYDQLTEEIEVKIIEDDEVRENTKTIGYYAMFEYQNGFKKTIYWSAKKMKAHALKYSEGYKADIKKGTAYTFWAKDFDGMAYKTLIRQLISKWGITSIEMQNALEADNSLVNEDLKPEVINNDELTSEVITPEPKQEIEPNIPQEPVADVVTEQDPFDEQ